MNDLPAVRWLLRVLLNPGWAPLTVVGLHMALAEFGLTHRFDHLLHFLGGAAIAYFLHGSIALVRRQVATIPGWMHFALTFSTACTVAVFWEFGEFASDQVLGTSVQQSLTETMLDLVFGVSGAAVALMLVAGYRRLIKGRGTCSCRTAAVDVTP